MGKRGAEEFFQDVIGVPISPGTVSNLEQGIRVSLAVPHAEATEAVHDAAVKHGEETGWKENSKKRWLWLASTLLPQGRNVVRFLSEAIAAHRAGQPRPKLVSVA